MNELSKIILVITLLAVIVGMSLLANQAGKVSASGGSPSLVRSALELVIGEEDTLTLKNDPGGVSWTSSDTGVVSVDNGGKVKGIATGTAEITAAWDGGSEVCKVFVVEKEFSFDDNILISIFWPPTHDYINDEQYKYMADAEIDWVMGSGDNMGSKEDQLKMLELCYKYGIHMTVGDSRFGGNLLSMSDKQIAALVAEYRNVPGANGYYMLDEPYNPNEFINAYRALVALDPNSYMHLNFLPYGAYSSLEMYKAQMDDWLKLCASTGVKQQYLMFDMYPFSLQAGSFNADMFYNNLNAVREVGLANGVKTADYIQSVEQSVAFRSMNEDETRFEINLSLAFGLKQLSYFTWFTPYNRSEPFADGIISYTGVPNPKYEFICRLNKEVHNIGPVLAKLDSLEVYVSRSSITTSVPVISDDFFVHSAETKKNFTVSYMRDRESGRNYCMVVNNNFSKPVEFRLQFDSAITSLEYISEEDGNVYSQALDADNIAAFELKAGGARLFRLPESFDFAEKRKWVPQTGENLALHAQVYCDSSLGSGGWYMSGLNDGQRFSNKSIKGWQSVKGAEQGLITLDFGKDVTFNRIDLYPAGDDVDYGENMPKKFEVAVSRDGENWYKLASAKDFMIVGLNVPSLRFDTVSARFVRILISEFNGDTVQLAEIEVYNDDGSVGDAVSIQDVVVVPRGSVVNKYKAGGNIARSKTVIVSSYPDSGSYKSWGWWPDFLVDGNYASGWTSDVKRHMDSGKYTEYAIVDLGDPYAVDEIRLIPLGCWPVDFTLSVSSDRKNWQTVATETKSKERKDEYSCNAGGAVGRYVMVRATKLRGTSADGYMLQLGEMEVYGTPVKDAEEARTLMDEFLKAGGNTGNENYKNVAALLDNANATQSQLDAALVAMLAEVGKALPEPEQKQQDPSVYKFEYVENVGEIAASTPRPTREPGSTPEGSGNNKNDKAARNAAIIAAGAVAATAAAIAVTAVVKSKKRKADSAPESTGETETGGENK